jgi:outer membrane protein assembly factor BamB
VYPNWTNGVFLSDRAFDPETQTYILYEGAQWAMVLEEHSYFPGETNYKGGNLFTTFRGLPVNATLVARDLATGKVKWTWFYQPTMQRAAPIISGGMVITGWPDGIMRFFDKDTGKLLHQTSIGAPVVVQPTIGKDSAGDSKIFVLAGPSGPLGVGDARFGLAGLSRVPGTIIALGLSGRAAQTTTVTSTSASTTTSTVVSTQPAKTTTVTSQITQTVGLPSEVTYAAVAVAVIAIIAAAVLTTRKKT